MFELTLLIEIGLIVVDIESVESNFWKSFTINYSRNTEKYFLQNCFSPNKIIATITAPAYWKIELLKIPEVREVTLKTVSRILGSASTGDKIHSSGSITDDDDVTVSDDDDNLLESVFSLD